LNSSLIEEGGLAVHPVTGQVWGIEHTLGAQPRNIYTIDLATGYPDSMVRLGLNGTEVPFGFDGLYILPDGTFLAPAAAVVLGPRHVRSIPRCGTSIPSLTHRAGLPR
jgi:hypothetical protein